MIVGCKVQTILLKHQLLSLSWADGWTEDGQTDGHLDEWTVGQMDSWSDRRSDGS